MEEYKAKFEALSNRFRGFPKNYKLSCFLSDLKDAIRLPIRMSSPTNLLYAYGLAKIQEEQHVQVSKKLVRNNSSYGT